VIVAIKVFRSRKKQLSPCRGQSSGCRRLTEHDLIGRLREEYFGAWAH
jgi:hypothetical protein